MQPSKPINNNEEKSLSDYIDLIETIARIEYSRLTSSAHIIDFSELVNIGAMAVHVITTTQKNACYNISYMSTAIRWAIRNELRRRYKWYTLRNSAQRRSEEIDLSADVEHTEHTKIRETIYETILSIDDLADAENPTQIKDLAMTPEENIEFGELSKAIRDSMKYLPVREKMVLESRFFKNKKIKEIADELKISSSRVSRIIQSGLDKIREQLKKQEMI